jgi:rhamnulokinase/L-fuculokinase
MIGTDGQLLSDVVHYRDRRTDGYEAIYDVVSREELYRRTGIQEMQINSIHQLYYLRKHKPDLLERTEKILFTPDLLNYFLTGEMRSEYTIASTSELLGADSREWDRELMGKIGLDSGIFCPITMPGSYCGKLSADVREELGAPDLDVVCIASHDTASAILATPLTGGNSVFISCGTWCLFGTELDDKCTNEKARAYGFTNEGGVDGKILFMRNITGTWLLQESVKRWEAEGLKYTYDDLDNLAASATSFRSLIDVDDIAFLSPDDMPAAIRQRCADTAQPVPDTPGAIVRSICEGLALRFRRSIAELEECTGKRCDTIHMIGGGAKSSLLCRMVADATGRTVIAGPIEATAIGNVAVQLIAAGEITDGVQARQLITGMDTTVCYESGNNTSEWDVAYDRYISIYS